jgi:hypothetical protein
MATPTVHTQISMPDPNAAPLNLIQLFQLMNLHLHSEITTEYTPYVKQNGEPGSDDQDKVWFELDSQGRPLAIKVHWNGTWRRVYNGMMNEVRGYSGNPGTDFDSTGWGRVGGEYDGWHLCNGNDGAPDYSDHFLIGSHMNNEGHSGYVDNEWVSWIGDDTGKHVGGEKDVTLTTANMVRPDGVIGEIEFGRYGITPGGGETLDSTKPLFGKVSIGDPTKNISQSVEAANSTDTPDPVKIIPPFVALAWIIFLGYRT